MGHLLGRSFAASHAQIGPVHVGAQVFAAHSAAGLPVYLDAQAFTQALPLADGLAQVSLGRVATLYKPLSRCFLQAIEIGEEFFHAQILPSGNY